MDDHPDILQCFCPEITSFNLAPAVKFVYTQNAGKWKISPKFLKYTNNTTLGKRDGGGNLRMLPLIGKSERVM
jgi:hypothetical protein